MRRVGSIAVVIALTLPSAVAGCGGSSGPTPSRTRTTILSSRLVRLPGLKRCPAPGALTTEGVGCAQARAVLRRFYGDGPLIDPGPSPAGWRCHQQETDHTSQGGDAYRAVCRAVAHPGRRFSYRWTSDIQPPPG
jgi:hypothetical protein